VQKVRVDIGTAREAHSEKSLLSLDEAKITVILISERNTFMSESVKMNIWQTLETARNQLRSQIAIAIQQEHKTWFDLCERLRRGDELLEQARILWSSPHPDSEPPGSASKVGDSTILESPNERQESAKARGERVRAAWVQSVSSQTGKSLPRLRGALFKNSRSETLGIAYSRENIRKPGHWFLGLPGNKYECAALLCETKDGQLRVICLSREFLTKNAPRFSTSKAWNQTKFNVVGRGNKIYLVLRTGELDVTDYINQLNNVL
jgi:hypothetical protein